MMNCDNVEKEAQGVRVRLDDIRNRVDELQHYLKKVKCDLKEAEVLKRHLSLELNDTLCKLECARMEQRHEEERLSSLMGA